MFKIIIQESVDKDIKGIPKTEIGKIFKRIKSLETVLSVDSFKLVNSDIYRIRQGDFRIFFEADLLNRIITVFKISHRKDAY